MTTNLRRILITQSHVRRLVALAFGTTIIACDGTSPVKPAPGRRDALPVAALRATGRFPLRQHVDSVALEALIRQARPAERPYVRAAFEARPGATGRVRFVGRPLEQAMVERLYEKEGAAHAAAARREGTTHVLSRPVVVALDPASPVGVQLLRRSEALGGDIIVLGPGAATPQHLDLALRALSRERAAPRGNASRVQRVVIRSTTTLRLRGPDSWKQLLTREIERLNTAALSRVEGVGTVRTTTITLPSGR